MSAPIPALVLGGSGYVAGELLRLIAGHPHFELLAVMSDSRPGEPVAQAFPHLASAYGDTRFSSQAAIEDHITQLPAAAVFSAAPHGAAAALIDALLTKAGQAGTRARVVDISADFRYRSVQTFESVYRQAHHAPTRIGEFTCALPEHLARLATEHVAHPGCFATATLLAAVPLIALKLASTQLFVAGITGSTGSGRKSGEGTHHPLRHSDLYVYNPLAHRHVPEMQECVRAACGVEVDIAFIPHSGPFARGIHVTVQAELTAAHDTAQVLAALRSFYAAAPFVRVLEQPPRMKDVVASNYAHLSAATNGRTVAVFCVIDNLAKGAAGGALQWMNRMFDLPETAGLTAPAPGWT
jgi:N-acetyl-gamma-glutamyl-phosphate reductase common form